MEDLSTPGLTVTLCEVEINGHYKAFVYCYINKAADVPLLNKGCWFVCEQNARKYFEVAKVYSDIHQKMTPEQEAEYATFKPRNRREMEAYING